jgi:hypothetical protein
MAAKKLRQLLKGLMNNKGLPLLALALAWLSYSARAEETERSGLTWTFGARPNYYLFRAEDIARLQGPSLTIDLGSGHISEHWMAWGTVSFTMGPYQPVSPKSVALDFTGTGLSANYAYFPFAGGLRKPNGAWGANLSLIFVDIIGRSIGTTHPVQRTVVYDANDDESPEMTSLAIRNYVMQVRDLTAAVGIVYSQFQPARGNGSRPELVMTRIEGIATSLNLGVPIYSQFLTTYEESRDDGPFQGVRRSGDLTGIQIFLQISAFFGV